MPHPAQIVLRGVHAHNLQRVDLSIPHDRITVITGVSGSGKSSLAVDALLVEARRRYLAAVAGPALHRLGKLGRSQVEQASGLRPGVLLGQARPSGGPRSTVGTVSGLLDPLRLLLARAGQRGCLSCTARLDRLERCAACGAMAPPLLAGLLSFNAAGACPGCRGLGVVDRVDPALLVADPARSLRQGALVPTTPKPYIVYSQVTMEVLDTVCRAHGFTVDTPWSELGPAQREVVFYGSDRVVVPFGKHPLESRMRWSGITPRPREEGHYKGIVTTIQGILSQKRNPGVLRFVRSVSCPDCAGSRLSVEARAVRLGGRSLPGWTSLPLERLGEALGGLDLEPREQALARPLLDLVLPRIERLRALGLGHVDLGRSTDSLSGGEARRIQLASCLAGGLGRLLYVLDEPSAGLHPREIQRLRAVLEDLRGLGNTVVMVEHDPGLVSSADWLVEVGPGAGAAGGRLVHDGPPRRSAPPALPAAPKFTRRAPAGWLALRGARVHNLKHLDVTIPLGCLVGVTGVSGAGKTSLAVHTVARALMHRLGVTAPPPGPHDALEGAELLTGIELVDAAPIGRSPRSNAATYTKLFDAIRALFAQQPEAKARGFHASRFSFNSRGGRCERCEGAGSIRVGMHFMPDVHLPCPACGGARFDEATLAVRFGGHNIHEVLALPVDRARDLFHDRGPIVRGLDALAAVGLGYLPLGQPATTLSGGEAARVKLAAHLARPPRGATLYVLDEPSVGLHPRDVFVLTGALRALLEKGHSVLVVDHDPILLRACEHLIELGPGGGERGGRLMAEGAPEGFRLEARGDAAGGSEPLRAPPQRCIQLRGVRTHNLRNVDVDIPHDALTVITGVSGSGKSSLAFDTLHAEAWRRFGESLPGHARRRLARLPRPALDSAAGLGPSVAVGPRATGSHPRSLVGSAAGLLPPLRLLWSRFGQRHCPSCDQAVPDESCVSCGVTVPPLGAGHFSSNRELGACPACDGLGQRQACDPERLISHPELGLWHGAMQGSRLGRHLGEPHGQHLATLATAAEQLGLELERPWCSLTPEAKRLALEGSGERLWRVRWRFRRGRRSGEHRFEGTWPGLRALVEQAWEREHGSRRGREIAELMRPEPCASCHGERLAPWPRAVRFGGWTLPALCALTVDELIETLEAWDGHAGGSMGDDGVRAATAELRAQLSSGARSLQRLGLGYLSLDRRSDTLSGGESRRVQLAGLLGSGLAGLCCVLDEPSIGLHPRDTSVLLRQLRGLVEEGNTVVVVEHDLEIIRAADHVLEIGPGAGGAGGRVVARGTPAALAEGSGLTGAWLSGRAGLPLRRQRVLPGERIELSGLHRHNLRDVDVSIPCGGLVALAGVSGSGKSTLMLEVLEPSLRSGKPVGCARVRAPAFDRVVVADDRPLGASPHSTPASYLGLAPHIAALFASSEAARAAGLGRASFLPGSEKGRCPACKGTGLEAVGLELLADAWLPCEACGGQRFRPELLTLEVDGSNIAEALGLAVDEARTRYAGSRALRAGLDLLARLGLGYLRLDQRTGTTSGGERRRLRLARALIEGERARGRCLFLLDEPSVGLHPADVARLLQALDLLVVQGHSVLIVEHDPALLSRCDHILELGPGGGPRGGWLIAEGSPEALASRGTPTGCALARALELGAQPGLQAGR